MPAITVAERPAWLWTASVPSGDKAKESRVRVTPSPQCRAETIKPYVDRFLDLAYEWDQNTFLVTRIGCGIAGFTPEQIAPLFDRALDMYNVVLPRDFYDILIARRKRLGIPLPPGITD